MHRGYSWPGLEKVSQTIYADGDEDKQLEDRKVSDVKVCFPPFCYTTLISLFIICVPIHFTQFASPVPDPRISCLKFREARKATRSAVRTSPSNLTSGYRKMCCQVFVRSRRSSMRAASTPPRSCYRRWPWASVSMMRISSCASIPA